MLQGLWDWFQWLYDTHGVNLPIFYDTYYRGLFAEGLLYTAYLSISGLAVSLTIGVLGSWVLGARWVALRWLFQLLVDFVRYTPPLVQLYFYYFGVSSLFTVTGDNGLPEPLLGNFAWAVMAISVYTGASNIAIFRASIDAVPPSLVEAGEALGLPRYKVFFLIVLPLAFRTALPTLNSNLVNMVKMTGIAMAIAVPEVLYVASQIMADEFNTVEMMNVVLVTFFSLVSLLVFLMSRWEKRMRIPGTS